MHSPYILAIVDIELQGVHTALLFSQTSKGRDFHDISEDNRADVDPDQ